MLLSKSSDEVKGRSCKRLWCMMTAQKIYEYLYFPLMLTNETKNLWDFWKKDAVFQAHYLKFISGISRSWYQSFRTKTKFHFCSFSFSCSVNWESQTLNATTYIGFLFIFGLLVPVVIIVYSYIKIIKTMRENTLRSGRVNKVESRVTSMIFVMIIGKFLKKENFLI